MCVHMYWYLFLFTQVRPHVERLVLYVPMCPENCSRTCVCVCVRDCTSVDMRDIQVERHSAARGTVCDTN